MKIAEALLIRADLQKKLASLKQRIAENTKVQDGDRPSEDPTALLIEGSRVIAELQSLITRTHRTNALVQLANGKSMLDALVERDMLALRHQLLIDAINQSKTGYDRYSAREIKWHKTLDTNALQKQADDIANALRQLNIQIQAANWQLELLQ